MFAFWTFIDVYSPYVLLSVLITIAATTKKIGSLTIILTFGLYMILLINIVPADVVIYVDEHNKFLNLMEKIYAIILPCLIVSLNIEAVICGYKLLREGLYLRYKVISFFLIVLQAITLDFLLFRFQILRLIK